MNKYTLIAIVISVMLDVRIVSSQAPVEEYNFKIYLPIILEPSPVDIHCVEPVGIGIGPWPVCPYYTYDSEGGLVVSLEGNLIHFMSIIPNSLDQYVEWESIRLVRMTPITGSIYDENLSENPVYDLSLWDIIAEWDPSDTVHFIDCHRDYDESFDSVTMVLGVLPNGDMLPDPRRAVYNYQDFPIQGVDCPITDTMPELPF